MHTDPKLAKKTDNLTVFFVLSGSARTKAARRAFVKLTPGVSKNTSTCFFFDLAYFSLLHQNLSQKYSKVVKSDLKCDPFWESF